MTEKVSFYLFLVNLNLDKHTQLEPAILNNVYVEQWFPTLLDGITWRDLKRLPGPHSPETDLISWACVLGVSIFF